MFKQSVCLVEFTNLYNILFEIKHLFSFNLLNCSSSQEFIDKIESDDILYLNSTVLLEKDNKLLLQNQKVNKDNFMVFDFKPLRIEKLIDLINIQLIKQRYNYQSKLKIKAYLLNLNSRIISYKTKELKLTEREIDIILFLIEQKGSQSVEKLQKKVWGYSFDLETHTVETHIYRLRKKIKNKFNDDKFILSDDLGYKI